MVTMRRGISSNSCAKRIGTSPILRLASAARRSEFTPGGRIASRGLSRGPRLLLADAAAPCSKAKSRTRPEPHAHASAPSICHLLAWLHRTFTLSTTAALLLA